jgi:hypothetical protein
MPNYQQSDIAGTKYTRSYQVNVQNGLSNKAITFFEEQIINLDDGSVVQQKAGNVSESLTADNASTAFPLLDPETGQVIVQGATMTYSGVYAALYSLYIHLATERDAAPDPS